MKMKLTALITASLLSVPAFAQSNIILYGLVDFGYVSLGNNSMDNPDTRYWDSSWNDRYKKYKSRNAIDSGITRENRFGIMGTENLGTLMGHSLKAVFVLETGLNVDAGSMLDNKARQTYVCLESIFGAVGFGRQYTPQYDLLRTVDPFEMSGLGSVGNVLFMDRRKNNLITYSSPIFGGFKITTNWTFAGGKAFVSDILIRDEPGIGTFGDDDEGRGNNGNVRSWAISPSFGWKNWFLGANYHSAKLYKVNFDGDSKSASAFRVYELYASYDFGFVKVGSALGRRTTKKSFYKAFTNIGDTLYDDVKLTQWMIGATFKITPSDSILTSYSHIRENKASSYRNAGPRISQWAIGYEHGLSRRTILYTQLALQNHRNTTDARWHSDEFVHHHGFFSIATDGMVGSVGSSSLNPDMTKGYRRGFAIGVRHSF